jgi:hypothetical protein
MKAALFGCKAPGPVQKKKNDGRERHKRREIETSGQSES